MRVLISIISFSLLLLSTVLSSYSFNETGLAAGSIHFRNQGESLLGLNQQIAIEADYRKLVRGDKLLIYGAVNPKSKKSESIRKLIGSLQVTSATEESVHGLINSLSSEVPMNALLFYALPMEDQVPLFIPMLRWIGDTLIDFPTKKFATVALIDTVDEGGAQTVASNKVTDYFRQKLCLRHQFRCVAESTITRTLWELSVTTSGSFKESDFHSFARMVGADLIIANRVVQDGDNVDILSVTHSSLEPTTKKNRAWWRLKIPMNQLDIEDGDFGTIVLPNRKSARSKLDLKISRYPNVQDIDLDMVTVVPINDQITAVGADGENLIAQDFFAKINGRKLEFQPDGSFQTQIILEGKQIVTIGYYIYYLDSNDQMVKFEEPVTKRVKIDSKPAYNYQIEFSGKIVNNNGLLISKLTKSRVNSSQ